MKVGGQHDEAAGDDGIDDEHVPESEAAKDRRGGELHGDGADRRGEGDHPGLERRQAEADLEEERQEEGRCTDPDPEEEGADQARPERRDAEEGEVDDRILDPPAAIDVGGKQGSADEEQDQHIADRNEIEAEGGRAGHEQGQPEGGEKEARPVEADIRSHRGCRESRAWRGRGRAMPTGTLIQKIQRHSK